MNNKKQAKLFAMYEKLSIISTSHCFSINKHTMHTYPSHVCFISFMVT